MGHRYLQDCKMAIVRSGLLKTLPKSALRVLFVYLCTAKWSTGVFEAGHKGTATLADLDVRDVRKGVKTLLKLGIIEQIHVGSSYTNRSVYRFNLERIEKYGFNRNNGIQDVGKLKFQRTSGDVKKPRKRIFEIA